MVVGKQQSCYSVIPHPDCQLQFCPECPFLAPFLALIVQMSKCWDSQVYSPNGGVAVLKEALLERPIGTEAVTNAVQHIVDLKGTFLFPPPAA